MGASDTIHQRSGRQQRDLDLARLIDEAPLGMAVLDRELRFLLCNRKLAEINGQPQDAHIGRTVAEMVPSVAPEVEEAFRSVLAGEKGALEVRVRGAALQEPDRVRAWVDHVRPMMDAKGEIDALLVTVQDVTDVEEARAALAERERVFRTSHQFSRESSSILRAIRAPDGTVVDFEWEFANPAAREALGVTSLLGRRLNKVLPGGRDHPDLFPRYVRMLETQGGDEVELHYDADGVTGWFRNSAVAIDADRVAVRFRNITARWRAREQLELVSRELKHRNRNLLTVVSGLLGLAGTSARDIPELVDGLQQQLRALAASQDLLTVTVAQDVPLDMAIRTALEPWEAVSIDIADGPVVMLEARAVMPLIMALSELATNSVKHGALSGAGSVSIGWHVAAEATVLSWVERGGPPVEKPTRRGLGTRLLEAAGISLPDGRVEQLFEPEGLTVRFHFRSGA